MSADGQKKRFTSLMNRFSDHGRRIALHCRMMKKSFMRRCIALMAAGQAIWTVGLGLGVMTLTMALLSSLKLYTRMDAMGVHFRMRPFHFKEQTIAWEDIDQIHVRKYSPILEYGGWGMRYGRNGKAFNVRGNYGIQIVKKNGKKVLIGTQRPEDAARQLSVHPLLV